MRQAVINGPFKYPGALCVEDEMGNVRDLVRVSTRERGGERGILEGSMMRPH
jgi:hypothetical protein